MQSTGAQRTLLPVAAARSRQQQPSPLLHLSQKSAPAGPGPSGHRSSAERQGGLEAASPTKCAPQHGEVRAAPPGLGRSAWAGAARTYPSPRLRPRQTCTGCVGLAGGGSRAVMQLLSLSQLRTEEGRSGGPIALHTHTSLAGVGRRLPWSRKQAKSVPQRPGAGPVRIRSGSPSLFTSARLVDAPLRLQSAHSVMWHFATRALSEVTDACAGLRDKLTHRSL